VTFQELIRQIVGSFDPERLAAVTKTSGWSITKVFGYRAERESEFQPVGRFTASDAADILASIDAAAPSNQLHVAVIDETDRLTSSETRLQLAELLKLLGDRGVRLTLIFTGVGNDLDEILGSHPSSFR